MNGTYRHALLAAMVVTMWTALLSRPAFAAPTTAPSATEVKRTDDVIYGRKFGVALTMDVFQPAKPNGKGVLSLVSGGWFSSKLGPKVPQYEPLLAAGYTVFAVTHGSQPKFHIAEIAGDIHRAVRFVRHDAKRWGVDPDHLGITGGSAGGHLTLTIATQGGPGDPKAADPVDRESSAVQAAVSFFPPTDFLNYGKPGADVAKIPVLKDFYSAFGPAIYTTEEWQILAKAISPVNFVKAEMAPTLLIHGDADTLVPVQQSRLVAEKAKMVKAEVKLIERAGKGHGWADVGPDMAELTKWFDEHLK